MSWVRKIEEYDTIDCVHSPLGGCRWCCKSCNLDRHMCPSCGTSVDHSEPVCVECVQLYEGSMTMTGSDVARVTDLETGLEDFLPEEAIVPRIQINHKGGTFKDNLTGTEFAVIRGILLGLVKQRVMWPSEMTNDGRPMCKSSDNITGYPLMEGTRDQIFPWDDAGLKVSDVPKDDYDRPTIPCEICPFTKWTKTASGKNQPPKCSERHTFPVLYTLDEQVTVGQAFPLAGIVSLQRTGISPSRTYLSAFVRGKLPLYSVYTELRLKRESRGSVEYAVPVFTKIGDVPQELWEDYALQYRGLRDFLRMPPRADDDMDSASRHTTAGNVPAAAVASTVVNSTNDPWGSPTGVVDSVVTSNTAVQDDDLPF